MFVSATKCVCLVVDYADKVNYLLLKNEITTDESNRKFNLKLFENVCAVLSTICGHVPT